MDAVTYPEAHVIDFLNHYLIALRVPHDAQPLAADFNVKWTPTLITLDEGAREHHRTVGFLPPEELIPSLLLGIAKTHFDHDRFDQALIHLDQVLGGYRKSGAAPEAIYLRGVSLFKSTHDPKPLKQAYELLTAEFPADEWTRRAYPYRLL
jgi:hypothetical protein